ncbi:citramalate synthase, partial [bacterium]|nr:citramalate synthase [bacterium]
MNKVKIYDTTLRDGSQMEEISFSTEDKLMIAKRLDSLGIHYIEGGWPGSNPRDVEFFNRIKGIPLKQAKIAAFGSTRRAKVKVEEDVNIAMLIEAQTPVVTIFGKSWDMHVREALRTSLEENLEMIKDSVAYLKSKEKE